MAAHRNALGKNADRDFFGRFRADVEADRRVNAGKILFREAGGEKFVVDLPALARDAYHADVAVGHRQYFLDAVIVRLVSARHHNVKGTFFQMLFP